MLWELAALTLMSYLLKWPCPSHIKVYVRPWLKSTGCVGWFDNFLLFLIKTHAACYTWRTLHRRYIAQNEQAASRSLIPLYDQEELERRRACVHQHSTHVTSQSMREWPVHLPFQHEQRRLYKSKKMPRSSFSLKVIQGMDQNVTWVQPNIGQLFRSTNCSSKS